MINIAIFDSNHKRTTIQATPGQSLMAAAVDANIDGIAADCGGTLTCATCHVMVRPDWLAKLPTISVQESDMLGFAASEPQAGSRLSCQLLLSAELDGMEVDLPASQY